MDWVQASGVEIGYSGLKLTVSCSVQKVSRGDLGCLVKLNARKAKVNEKAKVFCNNTKGKTGISSHTLVGFGAELFALIPPKG